MCMQKVWMCNYVHTFDPARSVSGVLSSSKHKSLKISCCYFPEGSAAVSMAAEAPFSTASQAAAFQVRQLQVLPQARAYIQELRKNKINTRSRGGRLVGEIWLSFNWILLTLSCIKMSASLPWIFLGTLCTFSGFRMFSLFSLPWLLLLNLMLNVVFFS